MIVCVAIIAWLSFYSGCSQAASFDIVRITTNNTAYLLFNGVAKAIVDDATIQSFNFPANALKTIDTVELRNYKIGPFIPSIAKIDGSPDDITRIEIMKSLAVMGRLLYDIHYIGEYMNPAVFKWNNRLMLVTGSNNGHANSKRTENALLEFRWYNHTFLSFTDKEKYLGITTEEVDILNQKVYGEDPRVVVLSPEKFHVYYVYPFQALTRIGVVEVAINPLSGVAEVAMNNHDIHPILQFSMRHKNWAPFESKDKEVLLLQNINPMIVVKPTIHPADGNLYADVVSESPAKEVNWPYGTIRGGTNAVLLEGRNEYLAFFHSKGTFAGNYMFSYVAGAYTFSGDAPYRLLKISAMPIMSEQFYTGEWSPMKTARIDYCFFPTSIILEGEEIIMSAGHQDHSGYIMKLKLQSVLDTMVSV